MAAPVQPPPQQKRELAQLLSAANEDTWLRLGACCSTCLAAAAAAPRRLSSDPLAAAPPGGVAELMNEIEKAVASYEKVLMHNPNNILSLTRYVVDGGLISVVLSSLDDSHTPPR